MKRVYRNNEMVYDTIVAREYLLEGSETDSDLPTDDVPAGSTAYNAAMTVMYMFDGSAWNQIGGE